MFTGIDMLLAVYLKKNITYIAGTLLMANSINPTLLLRSCRLAIRLRAALSIFSLVIHVMSTRTSGKTLLLDRIIIGAEILP